ncbi:hypothetical protein FRC16_008468 [Serendipita sp. 398]|nr:hypothetical protein FRC16_008468 [Serendipita sp. 398]
MLQSELHQVQLRETQLQNEVKESERLERQSHENREGINSDRLRVKEVEARLLQANEPVEAVKAEQKAFDASHQVRVSGLQQAAQEINLEIDKLEASAHSADESVSDTPPFDSLIRWLGTSRSKVPVNSNDVRKRLLIFKKQSNVAWKIPKG